MRNIGSDENSPELWRRPDTSLFAIDSCIPFCWLLSYMVFSLKPARQSCPFRLVPKGATSLLSAKYVRYPLFNTKYRIFQLFTTWPCFRIQPCIFGGHDKDEGNSSEKPSTSLLTGTSSAADISTACSTTDNEVLSSFCVTLLWSFSSSAWEGFSVY